jgi:2C-methyl-D-erythritol 2,4-cyclodiphosphate synthase
MRDSVAQSFGADVGRVSVKATTEEKMGFTGDGTGISATAAVLLEELPGG